MYGLREEILKKILKIKENHNLKMCIFGSRARGDYKYNSDIDIAILEENLSDIEKYSIMDDFDQIDCEYKIDLAFMQNISDESFRNSIEKEGIVL